MSAIIAKDSSKGQIVIPASIRKEQNIENGTQLSFTLNDDGTILVRKVPTDLDWANLLKDYPNEDVELDANGHYDPQKSPHFDEWMREG